MHGVRINKMSNEKVSSKVQNKRKPTRTHNSNTKKIKGEDKLTDQDVDNLNKLSRNFFNQSCYLLAESLLGKLLVRNYNGTILKGRIVETECYPGGEDKASCTHNGRRTPAIEPLYMEPGTTYVYMTYGMYHCLNISGGEAGGGVLIRALEPIEGLDIMEKLRAEKRRSLKEIPTYDLCGGPSKLCTGLNINKLSCNQIDLVTSNLLWIENDSGFEKEIKVIKASRIGINSAGKEWADKPYRFYILGNRCVSKTDKIKEDEYTC